MTNGCSIVEYNLTDKCNFFSSKGSNAAHPDNSNSPNSMLFPPLHPFFCLEFFCTCFTHLLEENKLFCLFLISFFYWKLKKVAAFLQYGKLLGCLQRFFPSCFATMEISDRNSDLKSLASHGGVRKLFRLIIEICLQRKLGIQRRLHWGCTSRWRMHLD